MQTEANHEAIPKLIAKLIPSKSRSKSEENPS